MALGAAVLLTSAALLIVRSGSGSGPNLAEAAPPETLQPIPAPSYEEELLPFIQKYCYDCHGNGAQEGGVSLDHYTSLESILQDRKTWEKLLKLVQLGTMPPSDGDQPTTEEREQAVAWLDQQLYSVDCSTEQNPGHVTIRRLNRTEYNNTIKSLFGIDFQPAQDFPADDLGHGFDNIGDVLTVPPLLIEKYLAAAESIAAIVARDKSPHYFRKTIEDYQPLLVTKGSARLTDNGVIYTSQGKLHFKPTFPRAGEYRLTIPARQSRGGDEDAIMEVGVGDILHQNQPVANTDKMKDFVFSFFAPEGKQEISIAFVNDFYAPDAKENRDRNLYVGRFRVEGPLDITESERAQLFLTRIHPDDQRSVAEAAQENLREFLPRAFRRPVTDNELQRYSHLVESVVDRGFSFPEGMGAALQAILVSPDFLFRVEGGRRVVGQVEMLDDFALASRLSYFLWSTCPDDELFQLARENRLHEPDVLRAQTLRLLRDPRSQALIDNFAGQWLGLRQLNSSEVDPNSELFPEFTPEIRQDLQTETKLFFGSIVRNDSSVFDLLSGSYTFLNERLADYYGIPGVTGEEFRRVELTGQHRQGVLTQGAVLTLTSYPTRTSPVRRGQWVLSVLLGDEPPPPPPTAPPLEETSSVNPDLTFRELLELHRADPGCASCHRTMDAIGFGLENFDAIGRWRTEADGKPIDASGELPGGAQFNGPDELIGILKDRRQDFARCLTEKLMTYALGRGVEWYDRCAIDSILHDLDKDDRFSTLIVGIVNSAPFQSRTLKNQNSAESVGTIPGN